MTAVLDEHTKQQLNGISIEELKDSHSFNRLIGYGVGAVAHVHLMRKAQDVASKRLTGEEFCGRYAIKSIENSRYGFHGLLVPIVSIEKDGIFIPQPAYLEWQGRDLQSRQLQINRRRRIWLFSPDYGNIFDVYRRRGKEGERYEYAWQLMDRVWKSEDFQDAELVRLGILFGEDMWKSCVINFDEYSGAPIKTGYNQGHITKIQPQHITELGRRLIKYYSERLSLNV